MKKKILASLLLSTVMVSQVAVLTTAHAETTDDKIAAQDNKISTLTDFFIFKLRFFYYYTLFFDFIQHIK